ncbi:MAG: hypothetical protein JNK85_29005 [Verrucomicrobiales bacterium]|nr:hypothetical protein [Verrucomicrobiales bacterium]
MAIQPDDITGTGCSPIRQPDLGPMSTTHAPLRNPFRRLHPGCYVVQFLPDQPYHGPGDHPADRSRDVREYLGTIRIVVYRDASDHYQSHVQHPNQAPGEYFRLSGDLYATPSNARRPTYEEIPIFPRDDYRFHLRATAVQPWAHGGFDLTVQSHEFRDGRWLPPNSIELRLAWLQTQHRDPNPFDHLEGEVRLTGGGRIGRVRLTWVSPYLRRAIVELDTIGGLRPPTEALLPDGKIASDWQTAFEPAGWYVDHRNSDQPVIPPSQVWAEFELQQALPALRDSTDTDHEWRYHVFCVGQLEDQGRGYQFDARGTDGKDNYFESIVLAANFQFPEEPDWGRVKGARLQDTALYFRVAVHEVGHAMKLEHNEDGCGFMATTDGILQEALRRKKDAADILDCIAWSFAPDDLERLRHWPDIVVRPGGQVDRLPLPGIDSTTPEHSTEVDVDVVRPTDLHLVLSPKLDWFPIGAPVRIDLRLENRGKESVRVPLLRLKAGTVSGWVRRGDATYGFLTLARTLDNHQLEVLGPGKAATGSISLLRGPDGALFGEPGPCQVTVKLDWFDQGKRLALFGTTEVKVSTWIDDDHRKAATRLITTKDTLAGFAIGGDGFADGNQAINVALANPILRPHFAIISFRRRIRDSATQVGNLGHLLREFCLGDENSFLLADAEVRRLTDLLVSVDRRNKDGLGTEKMLVALRLIVGRLSDATLETVQVALPDNVSVEQAFASKEAPKPADSRTVPPKDMSKALKPLGRSIWHTLDGARIEKPQKPPADNSAEPAHKSFLASSPFDDFRSEFSYLGIPPHRLLDFLQRLNQAGISDDTIVNAAITVVDALHRNLPLGIVNQSRDIHASLVANLLANLAIGGVKTTKELLRSAALPINNVSPLDQLLQFAGRNQHFGRMEPQSLAELTELSKRYNREFAFKVSEYLVSGPATPSQISKLQNLAERVRALSDPPSAATAA